MPKEYTSTLLQLRSMQKIANDVNLTLDRQIDFDDRIKGYLEDLIRDIEAEGTEAGG